jgi:hypothetical protein
VGGGQASPAQTTQALRRQRERNGPDAIEGLPLHTRLAAFGGGPAKTESELSVPTGRSTYVSRAVTQAGLPQYVQRATASCRLACCSPSASCVFHRTSPEDDSCRAASGAQWWCRAVGGGLACVEPCMSTGLASEPLLCARQSCSAATGRQDHPVQQAVHPSR